MMHSIMLIDRPPFIIEKKLTIGWEPYFYEKVVLSKQSFYENLGRVLPDPSEISKNGVTLEE